MGCAICLPTGAISNKAGTVCCCVCMAYSSLQQCNRQCNTVDTHHHHTIHSSPSLLWNDWRTVNE
jgi:hypothetical protein